MSSPEEKLLKAIFGNMTRLSVRCTYDSEAGAYYFRLADAKEPFYKTQREVQAILDIASDGTLAGVELVAGDLPPPPKRETKH